MTLEIFLLVKLQVFMMIPKMLILFVKMRLERVISYLSGLCKISRDSHPIIWTSISVRGVSGAADWCFSFRFSVEAKNIGRSAGEWWEFFAIISMGGLKGMKILTEVQPLDILAKSLWHSPVKQLIVLASTLNSEAKTPNGSTTNFTDWNTCPKNGMWTRTSGTIKALVHKLTCQNGNSFSPSILGKQKRHFGNIMTINFQLVSFRTKNSNAV